MHYITRIKQEVNRFIEPEKAAFSPRFFQAFPGGYGEGDRFIGVRVPPLRKIARRYFREISLKETELLLQDPIHEYRLAALFILCYRFAKAAEPEQEEIVNLYLNNLAFVNNWDLVDASAPHILGAYLLARDKEILFQLAASGNLWRQRVAVLATLYFIRHNRFIETLQLARQLLQHEHDLMHKAVGWMLREIGKRDFKVEYNFLQEHYRHMPRTMLRYAIEHFDPGLRRRFLEGLV
ncbi:MAG TPA: DNA alkylation repair protein [Bacillota bacterium]|nr:DNA alkylation repair protein [Bacillota bacterium]